MNKSEFKTHIATKNSITQDKANNVIDIFTNSIISALGEGKEVSLVGFGNFLISTVEAKEGRNPSTGEVIQVASHKRTRFKISQKLKDSIN